MFSVNHNPTLMKVLGIITGLVACCLLYYGTVMLLMVPGYPGEGYFAKGRVVYGVIPTALSVALLLLVGWFWSRATGYSLWRCAIWAIFWSGGLIGLFWVGLIVIAGFRQS